MYVCMYIYKSHIIYRVSYKRNIRNDFINALDDFEIFYAAICSSFQALLK